LKFDVATEKLNIGRLKINIGRIKKNNRRLATCNKHKKNLLAEVNKTLTRLHGHKSFRQLAEGFGGASSKTTRRRTKIMKNTVIIKYYRKPDENEVK